MGYQPGCALVAVRLTLPTSDLQRDATQASLGPVLADLQTDGRGPGMGSTPGAGFQSESDRLVSWGWESGRREACVVAEGSAVAKVTEVKPF